MPIKLRLSLIVAITTTILLVVGGFVLEANLGSGIRGTLKDMLRQSAARVQVDLSKGGLVLSRPGQVPTIVKDQNMVQVLSPIGQVEYATETSGVIPLLNAAELRQAASESGVIQRLGSNSTLLLAEPAPNGEGVLVVGSSMDEVGDAIARVRDGLLIGGPLLVLLAALGGWLLAGRALRPVEQLRNEAERISAEIGDQRLAVASTSDEVERLGRTLNGLLDRLQGGMKHQKEFISAASHELRTPIVALRAELEVAQLPGRSIEELRSSLEVFSLRLEQLSRLAEELLLLARGGEQALALELSLQPLEPLVAQSLQVLRSRASRAGVSLVVDGDSSVTCTVDSFRFRQVVENLVENAIAHATGSPFVEISLRYADRFAVLEVNDIGPGFPADFLPHAFDRFSRAKASRPRNEGGAGLGLPIVRMLVEAQGGTVEVGNRPEKGAAVIVRFPADPQLVFRDASLARTEPEFIYGREADEAERKMWLL